MKKVKKIERSCETCDGIFYVYPSDLKYNACRFCSRACTKPMYSKLFKGNKTARGHTPWNKGLTGVKTGKKGPRPHVRPWNYKHGDNTTRTRKDMTTWEYRSWRSKVFARDNYTCQICEQYSGALHADHIKKWSDNEKLRYNVDNGRTLCVPCHYYITFKRKMKPGTRWCNFTAGKVG